MAAGASAVAAASVAGAEAASWLSSQSPVSPLLAAGAAAVAFPLCGSPNAALDAGLLILQLLRQLLALPAAALHEGITAPHGGI